MIVVTGAAGRLGRRVVQLLVDQNREVLATDQLAADDLPAEFVRCDLVDAGAVEGILKDAEAVVHMGAIPGPQREDPRVIFDNNVASTFNVMMSAAELGLRRVVFSSSAFGMGWAHDGNAFVPLYLPLDEEHPMMPFEPYGLSKQVGEDIGRMIARNSDTTVVSLRFTNVPLPEVRAEFPWPAPNTGGPTDTGDVGLRRGWGRGRGPRTGAGRRDRRVRSLHDRPAFQPFRRAYDRPCQKQLWRPGGDTGRAGRHRQRNQYGKGAANPGLETALRLEVTGGAESDHVGRQPLTFDGCRPDGSSPGALRRSGCAGGSRPSSSGCALRRPLVSAFLAGISPR